MDDIRRIIEKIERSREKYREKLNKDLYDRVKHEAEKTLKWFNQREARGYTTRESLREIEKSINNKKKYED